MTRDEILNMPAGVEMDMLIATKVFNKQPHPNKNKILGQMGRYASPLHYSTAIMWAFEALHKWLDNNKTYAVQIETVNIVSGRLHDVVLWGMDDQETYDARAEDLALAISRVLLLAVMEAQ